MVRCLFADDTWSNLDITAHHRTESTANLATLKSCALTFLKLNYCHIKVSCNFSDSTIDIAGSVKILELILDNSLKRDLHIDALSKIVVLVLSEDPFPRSLTSQILGYMMCDSAPASF